MLFFIYSFNMGNSLSGCKITFMLDTGSKSCEYNNVVMMEFSELRNKNKNLGAYIAPVNLFLCLIKNIYGY